MLALVSRAYKTRVYRTLAYQLGSRFKAWREATGLTQAQVAARLGVEQQTISDWERNRAQPHFSRALALDGVYGLPPGTVMAALQEQPGPIDDDPQFSLLSSAWAELADEDRQIVADMAQRLRRRT